MTALDELVRALETATDSVFRLEAHQDYPDDELWQAHLRGDGWETSDDLAWWCALVAGNRGRGVAMARVRVVTDLWTPYTRWEIEQHFPHNVRAGEDVRLLRDQLGAHRGAQSDFWLVDDARAWWLRYDEAGVMTVAEAPAEAIPELLAVRDRSFAAAESLVPAAT